VKPKQTDSSLELISLSVRVPKETADRLKQIADREYRPVAAEIRRLIQERIDNDELLDAA
jgi:predicted DNA-binding protein